MVLWLAFALAPATLRILVTGSAFVLLLLIDYRLADTGLLTETYIELHRNVTCIVVPMLTLTVIFA